MRSRWLLAGICVASVAGGSLLLGGPEKEKAPEPEKRTAEKSVSNEPGDSNSRVLTGTVVEYKAGASLTLKKDSGDIESLTFDEGITLAVDPGVKKGAKVKVTEKVMNGSRWLTVELTSA